MAETEANDPAPAARDPEDVGDALRFTHAVGMQNKKRVVDLAASLYAAIETLVAHGVLPIDEYQQRRERTLQRENQQLRSDALVVIHDTPDKYALPSLPAIDCEARLPLCRARCCTLTFPLSAQDLDERVVRWDYAQPYQIARRADGYCVHNRAGTHDCQVYERRPAVCRQYDCRNDQRIWRDFEQRIPAP